MQAPYWAIRKDAIVLWTSIVNKRNPSLGLGHAISSHCTSFAEPEQTIHGQRRNAAVRLIYTNKDRGGVGQKKGHRGEGRGKNELHRSEATTTQGKPKQPPKPKAGKPCGIMAQNAVNNKVIHLLIK